MAVLSSLVILGLAVPCRAQNFLMTDGAQWETCSGTFYDSGGEAGNYAISESMTATLCPTGGPGAGPFTRVTFTAWGVGLTDLFDNLVIHNGADASAPVLATGSGLNSLLGQTFVSTDQSGCLTFVWTSDLLLNGSGWAASIESAPDAGGNGSVTVCSTAPALDLFQQLTGTPDPGGSWTYNNGAVSNTYVPATDPAGTYTYTVLGVPPCPNASATVVVNKVAAPQAGGDNTVVKCSSDAVFDLRDQLVGPHANTGSWSGPSPVVNNQFTPASMLGGTYRYVVLGAAPCVNDTAELFITVVTAPDAGSNGSINLCSSAASYDLFTLLGGTPDPGGAWFDPANVPHDGSFQPGVDPVGIYTYRVQGQSPCGNDAATVTVSVQAAGNAGTSTALAICTNGALVNIKNLLGTGLSTGAWTGPSTVTGNQYNPVTMDPGVYTYTVPASGVCPAVAATVNVTEVLAPRAGNDVTRAVCSNGTSVDLFQQLTGSPDQGGSWTNPSDQPFPTGVFIPGTHAPGAYSYTVVGNTPCANDISVVTINQTTAPNAGSNGTLTVCSNGAAVALLPLLGGSPNSGGTWFKPIPPGGTLGSGSYNPTASGQPQGIYTYVVAGTGPCVADSSTVTVTEVQAPNAGTNGSITLCSTNASVNLFGLLGGGPSGGGNWLNPSNQPFGVGILDPALHPQGVYKYIVQGNTPCGPDTGFVTVTIHQAPNAGLSGDTTVCCGNGSFNLLTVLNGNPQGGGTWSGGSATFSCPSSNEGAYTYTVLGTAPCPNATAIATVNTEARPNAGIDGTATFCSNVPAVSLFSYLTGGPNTGGSWFPGDPGGVFTPGTSAPGVYTYVVTGVAPCTNDSATVTVNVTQAPNSGIAVDIATCSSQPSVDLFSGLAGSPDINGTWSAQGTIAPGTLSGSIFTLNGAPPGDYEFRYQVPAIGLCPSTHTDVEVHVTGMLNAGSNGSRQVCRNNTQYNLFNALGSNPQQGGIWEPVGNSAVLVGSFLNATQLAPSPPNYVFRYRLPGAAGCPADTAFATITIIAPPEAGPSATVPFQICSDATSTSLLALLPGAQPGGFWRRVCNNNPFGGNYNPAVDSTCVFMYIKPGTAPCANDTARVSVTEFLARDPGGSTTVTHCVSDPPFSMTASLFGTPMPGSWTSCTNQPHGVLFEPGLDPECTYTYTVPALGACPLRTSTLTVNVSDLAEPGQGGSTTICNDDGQVALIGFLFGDPDGNGVWTDPNGAVITNGILNADAAQEGVYTYAVEGETPCPVDSAGLELFVSFAPEAGTNTTATLCTSSPQVNMLSLLNGGPQSGGTWSGPPGHPGFYEPATDNPGSFTYTVLGTAPCDDQQATLTINESPQNNAGCNTSVSVCRTQSSFAFESVMGCGPLTSGGTWRNSNNVVVFFFDPAASPLGANVFTYTVPATASCPAASATLVINNQAPANAGLDGSMTFCSSSPSAPLFSALAGAQLGGTWRGPLGADDGIYDPANEPAGNYWYRVTASSPCPTDSAFVQVIRILEPNAGSGGTLTTCGNDNTVYQLLNSMQGAPDPGGTWSGPLSNPGLYIPGSNSPGTFKYRLNGNGPCPADSAYVQVIEYAPVDAGENETYSVCTDAMSFQLIDQLDGNPTPGGQWFAPGNVSVGPTFVPGQSPCGVYTYRLSGTAPCLSDSATLEIQCTPAADAGISNTEVLCPIGPLVPLISLLDGTPEIGGIWRGPDGQVHPDDLNPVSDPAGTYRYRVQGDAPCASDSATVTIQYAATPDAGIHGTIAACTSADAVDLFAGLNGTPQTNGNWPASVSSGFFNAQAAGVGNYPFLYTVPGNGVCGPDTASVMVVVSAALNAGTDVSTTICEAERVNLFNLLGGGAMAGGVWRDLDNTGALDGDTLIASIAGAGVWEYRYVLLGNAQCDGDSSLLTITVLAGPNAGDDATSEKCSNVGTIQLINELDGSPDAGGNWFFGPGFTPVGPTVSAASQQSGFYHYVVPGSGGCPSDSATLYLAIFALPNAGQNASIAVCENGADVTLFNELNGTPDAGGTWSNGDGIYQPPFDPPGTFTYTVNGEPGVCPNSTAQVIVTEQQVLNAGNNDVATLCSSAPAVQLIELLAGSPQSGGTWTDEDHDVHGPAFNPGTEAGGVFTYTVTGTGVCEPDSATVTITVVPQPDAGEDSLLNVCSTNDAVVLFAALGPEADAGGTWADVSGAGPAFVDGVLDATQVLLQQYQFTYTVQGTGPCLGDVATITVEVGEGLDPGESATDTICGGLAEYSLFSSLGGDPSPGGVWSEGSGGVVIDPASGVIDPSSVTLNTTFVFSYTVDDPGCGVAASVVNLVVSPFPDPGADSSVVVCSTFNPFQLITALGGEPETGGFWTDADGTAVNDVFNPATQLSGNYIYHLAGNAHCADTTATVSITVNQPPSAGADGGAETCNSGAYDLTQMLSGNAQAGGTWSVTSGDADVSGSALQVDGLDAGPYGVRYTVQVVSCGSDAADFLIQVLDAVDVTDTTITCDETTLTYSVSITLEGGDPASYSVTGLDGALASNVFLSSAIPLSQGFTLLVTDVNDCAPRTIIGGAPCSFDVEVIVPESFTPNGDLINDVLVIPGIEAFPTNSIVIFNRWGAEVYSAAGYDNRTVRWDGTSTDALIPGELPTGTYYYVLELGNDHEPYKGFIYLNR